MTLAQLEYALMLQKHGSFKRAAEQLSISQPGLSLQIQKLEDETGVILFNRSSSPIQPTEDGRQFLIRAEEIVTNARRLSEYARGLQKDYNGSLKLGIIPTLAPFLVPLFADALQRDYPNFKLDIREYLTDQVIQGVRSGEIDAGIISTPATIFGIDIIPVFYEKFFFYSSNKKPEGSFIQLKDIDYSQLWLLEEGNCFRDQVNNFCDLNKLHQNKHFVYRSNSIDALVRMVDNKGGITILPELTTLSLSGQQEMYIKEIKGKPKAREISIIVPHNHDKDRYIEKLKSYIQENIPRHMLSAEGLEIVDPGIKVT